MSCGVGGRRSSDPVLLWLWHRPVARAPIPPLAWEPPYAIRMAQEMAKRQKKKKKKKELKLSLCNKVSYSVNMKLYKTSFFCICTMYPLLRHWFMTLKTSPQPLYILKSPTEQLKNLGFRVGKKIIIPLIFPVTFSTTVIFIPYRYDQRFGHTDGVKFI